MRVECKPRPRYWCQYDNAKYPGGSCNMTSAWMAIEWFSPGKVKNPDVLLRLCDEKGWDRHELSVIDKILEMHGVQDESSYTYSMEDVKNHLQKGLPVIIQGMYTSSGHIVLVYGFDTDKGVWLVNDPAGKWDPYWSYGGPAWKSGAHVEYASKWFREKSAPDGKVWAHLLSKKVKK